MRDGWEKSFSSGLIQDLASSGKRCFCRLNKMKIDFSGHGESNREFALLTLLAVITCVLKAFSVL